MCDAYAAVCSQKPNTVTQILHGLWLQKQKEKNKNETSAKHSHTDASETVWRLCGGVVLLLPLPPLNVMRYWLMNVRTHSEEQKPSAQHTKKNSCCLWLLGAAGTNVFSIRLCVSCCTEPNPNSSTRWVKFCCCFCCYNKGRWVGECWLLVQWMVMLLKVSDKQSTLS